MQKDPDKATDDESFLSRWSRRKSGGGSAPPEQTDAAHEPLENDPTAEALRVEEPEDGPVLTDEDMPSIDSLNENSDYSGFMSEGVSERLRKLALRKLFQGAGFNIRDGLDDYDDDFTAFPALGDLITSDMKHQMEMAEKRKKEAQEAAEREAAEKDETTQEDGAADSETAAEETAAEESEADSPEADLRPDEADEENMQQAGKPETDTES